EFELFEIDSVVAGHLAWDWTQIERVLPAWVNAATEVIWPDPRRTLARGRPLEEAAKEEEEGEDHRPLTPVDPDPDHPGAPNTL
ncbi:MAG: hypothetical protein ACLGIA_08430, partial [Actinomycetes bacterium]